MLSLFNKYPKLEKSITKIDLCNLPTPILKMSSLGKMLGVNDLYVKNDGKTASYYGGNKVRKLEYLLAEAKKNNVKEVLTFGFAGSNHATATAIYANKVGLRSISVLCPQENSETVKKNIILSHYANAKLCMTTIDNIVNEAEKQKKLSKENYGVEPYVIPAGGSSCLGTLGYVNAAFELKTQIDDGIMPEPDYIYLPLGTCGTAVGLLIGLKLLGLKSKIVAVRVVDAEFMPYEKVKSHFNKTVDYLISIDESIQKLTLSESDLKIDNNYNGKGYGIYTSECIEAMELIKSNEEISLEGTYSGKALSCLIGDSGKNIFNDKIVLFLNTFNANENKDVLKKVNYDNMPVEFQDYFND